MQVEVPGPVSRAEHGPRKFAGLNLKQSLCLDARRKLGLERVGRMRKILHWVGWVVLAAAIVALAIISLN